jgi:nitrogen fixation/metabolism regulation signal transduction histidine kinase
VYKLVMSVLILGSMVTVVMVRLAAARRTGGNQEKLRMYLMYFLVLEAVVEEVVVLCL